MVEDEQLDADLTPELDAQSASSQGAATRKAPTAARQHSRGPAKRRVAISKDSRVFCAIEPEKKASTCGRTLRGPA